MLRRLTFIVGILVAALVAGLLLLPMTSGERALAQAGATPSAVATIAPVEQDTIWSGVVIATNVASPKPPPPELREFAGRLKRVFGYNQFELLGSASKPIGNRTENWLVRAEFLAQCQCAPRDVEGSARRLPAQSRAVPGPAAARRYRGEAPRPAARSSSAARATAAAR